MKTNVNDLISLDAERDWLSAGNKNTFDIVYAGKNRKQ